MSVVLLDLDDFKDDNTSLELLFKIKAAIPQFKVTVFAIPKYTSRVWIEEPYLKTWIDFVPHGWDHHSTRESQYWTKQMMLGYMQLYLHHGFTTRGFKAPGWQISDGCYEALAQEGWWVADQSYNNQRRPSELRAYVLGETPPDTFQIHGHIGHLGGHNANELSLIMDQIMAHKDSEFKFIREVME